MMFQSMRQRQRKFYTLEWKTGEHQPVVTVFCLKILMKQLHQQHAWHSIMWTKKVRIHLI